VGGDDKLLWLQEFMRDVRQAEVLLSQQDSFLSKEKTPVSINWFMSIVFFELAKWTETMNLKAGLVLQNTLISVRKFPKVIGRTS